MPEMKFAAEELSDEELLYRSVSLLPKRSDVKRTATGDIAVDAEGRYLLSSEAFGDGKCQPSVFRAALLDYDPSRAKLSETDVIVSFSVSDIRHIDTVTAHNGKRTVFVIADPNEHSSAHALIVVNPDFTISNSDKKHFRRLKQALLRVAKWEIPLEWAGEKVSRE